MVCACTHKHMCSCVCLCLCICDGWLFVSGSVGQCRKMPPPQPPSRHISGGVWGRFGDSKGQSLAVSVLARATLGPAGVKAAHFRENSSVSVHFKMAPRLLCVWSASKGQTRPPVREVLRLKPKKLCSETRQIRVATVRWEPGLCSLLANLRCCAWAHTCHACAALDDRGLRLTKIFLLGLRFCLFCSEMWRA